MTRVLPRTNFHSSELIRRLTDLSLLGAVEPEHAFAEKLGQWVHFTDAIILSDVHSGGMASAPKMHREARSGARAAVGAEFDRVRTNLTNSVAKSFSPKSGKAHIELPVSKFDLHINIATAFVPYRRFYDAHQRDMELNIQPLRFNVREALTKTSPALKKLADMDAAFEGILGDRESKLLSTVPVLLKKRFEQLFNIHQQTLADTQQADNPAGWMQAQGWLARFCNDLQTLLLAELDFRLQPTVGLIEAFNDEIRNETHNE